MTNEPSNRRQSVKRQRRLRCEAIVPLGCRRYLVLHDDDKVLGTEVVPPAHGWPRKKHEAAYAYLRLCR